MSSIVMLAAASCVNLVIDCIYGTRSMYALDRSRQQHRLTRCLAGAVSSSAHLIDCKAEKGVDRDPIFLP